MNIQFTCNQIESLIGYFIEGKLAPSLLEFFNQHLKKCPKCRKKVEQVQKVMTKYAPDNNPSESKPDKELIGSLSAYMDNELDTGENVKIKKMTILNPNARQKLESMYKFKKIMHNAYEKTKNDTKFDYSKSIVATLNEGQSYTTTYFRNIIILFVLLLIAVITGLIYLYF